MRKFELFSLMKGFADIRRRAVGHFKICLVCSDDCKLLFGSDQRRLLVFLSGLKILSWILRSVDLGCLQQYSSTRPALGELHRMTLQWTPPMVAQGRNFTCVDR
mmetsp:Transcript_8785/g.29335  ORF Transcript_8785/g.29335 Transcript_8785/m.29335 type:complete len:104 (-) Transcript_8785:1684-1995(-)